MKKIILLFYGLLFFINTQAQTDTTRTLKDYQNELSEIYSEIDTSRITTGILLDRVITLFSVDKYDGKNQDVVCTKSKLRKVYSILQRANYRKDTLGISRVKQILNKKNKNTAGLEIPIYILNYEYNKIKKDAKEKGLMYLQGGKAVVNTSKSESPYEVKQVFMVAPEQNYTFAGDNFDFIINSSNIFTNISEEIKTVYADYDDGFGEQEIKLNRKINISYAELGEKTIKFTIETNKGKFRSSFNFTAKKSRTTPDQIFHVEPWSKTLFECIEWEYNDDPPFQLECVEEGWVTYYYSSKLYKVEADIPNTKSLLIVEGFDADNSMYFSKLWETFNRQNLANCILANGYDIYILNFDKPTRDIYLNAETVKKAISIVKNEQLTNNELIVVGGSMGGLVTRVALREMELAGEDTQTRLWVSFDSPQKGANIPLGVQLMINQLITDIGEDDQDTRELKVARDILRTKAAKQMLLYHFDKYPDVAPAPERDVFVADLNQKGLPQTCRNIAVTNGASNGTGQGYSAGSSLLEFVADPWYGFLRVSSWAVPNGGSNVTIMERKKTLSSDLHKKVSNTDPLDSAPGGFRSTMKDFADADDSDDYVITAFQHNHAFIPAISALALDVDDYHYNFKDDPNRLDKTPFDMVYFPQKYASVNQEHVWVSNETANNILDELMPEYLTIGQEWVQGEIQALKSIHIVHGFHASASNKAHVSLGNALDRSMLTNESWVPSDDKTNKVKHKPKSTNNILLEKDNINIYPNPTSGILKISNFNSDIHNIAISDITGRYVNYKINYSKNIIEINISHAKSGIYFLRLQSKNSIKTFKIIKR